MSGWTRAGAGILAAMVVTTSGSRAQEPEPLAPAAPVEGSALQPRPASGDLPFPDDARHAFVDLRRLVSESAMGRAAGRQLEALRNERVASLNQRNEALQT